MVVGGPPPDGVDAPEAAIRPMGPPPALARVIGVPVPGMLVAVA